MLTCRAGGRRDKVAPVPRVYYCPMDPAGGAIREARVAFMQPCRLDFHRGFWNRELCFGEELGQCNFNVRICSGNVSIVFFNARRGVCLGYRDGGRGTECRFRVTVAQWGRCLGIYIMVVGMRKAGM